MKKILQNSYFILLTLIISSLHAENNIRIEYLSPKSVFSKNMEDLSKRYKFLNNASILTINPNNPYSPNNAGIYHALKTHQSLLTNHPKLNVFDLKFSLSQEIPSGFVSDENTKQTEINFPITQSFKFYDILSGWIDTYREANKNIDAIILYTLGTPLEAFLYRIASDKNIPVIVHHSLDLSEYPVFDFSHNKNIRHVTVNSGSTKLIQQNGRTADTLHPPINSAYFDDSNQNQIEKIKINFLSTHAGLNNNNFKILAPSRLNKMKGVFDLLKAAQQIKKYNKCFSLIYLVQGDSESLKLKEELIAEAKLLGLYENIVFIDMQNQPSLLMKALYQFADISVLPSLNEASGLVLQESQSQGTPVIAYKTGGIPEVIEENQTGYLARKGNITELAEKIYSLMTDKTQLNAMGQRSKLYAKQLFSPEKRTDEYLNYLNEVIKNFNQQTPYYTTNKTINYSS